VVEFAMVPADGPNGAFFNEDDALRGLASTEVVEFQNSPRCRFCGRVEVAIGPEG
jgi:hypothetical protein